MTTVVCVLVRGNVPYQAHDVVRLRAMVHRHLPQPFRFLCFTDQGKYLPTGIEVFAVEPMQGQFGWWSKLHIFRDDVGLKGRVLYLDLDSLVVGSLQPILNWPAPLAVIPDGGSTFKPRDRRRVVKRFNTSVMAFDAGVAPQLFRDFTPNVARDLWGDQDLLAEQLPDTATMPIEWFPRLSSIGAAGIVPDDARVILAKKPKPAEAAGKWPWVNAIWSAA